VNDDQSYQFDPGIISTLLASLNLQDDSFRNMRLDVIIASMMTTICFSKNVLFDPRALLRGYLSAQWLDEHWNEVRSNLYPINATVKLGDNRTVDYRCKFKLYFADQSQKKFSATITADVIDMPEMSLILGLPDLTRYFYDLPPQLLTEAKNRLDDNSYDCLPLAMDAVHPWSDPPMPLAPQELDTMNPARSLNRCIISQRPTMKLSENTMSCSNLILLQPSLKLSRTS
jgi:hypothetical protein